MLELEIKFILIKPNIKNKTEEVGEYTLSKHSSVH